MGTARGPRRPAAHTASPTALTAIPAAEQGLTFVVYTPEPDTPARDNLALLAAWAATPEQDADRQVDPTPTASQAVTGDDGPA